MKKTKLEDLGPYQTVGTGHKLSEIALVLLGDDGDEFAAFGTGFFIAPGLVITAKHVMQEYWARYHYRLPFPKRKTEKETNFNVRGLQFYDSGSRQGLWYAEVMWVSDFTDTAFLFFKPENDDAKDYRCEIISELTMYAPKPGEKVVSFGYPDTEVDLIQRTPTMKFDYRLRFTRSIGNVLGVHEKYFKRGYVEFPSIETDARFDRGMSGGPVFNASGQICGVVSAGNGPTFVALLWPAMLTQLDVDLQTGNPTKPFLVHELLDKGSIRQTGWNEVYEKMSPQFEPYIDDDDYWRIGWK
ncbi:MAG: serine protease [Pyrinomonadaceae bacterium]